MWLKGGDDSPFFCRYVSMYKVTMNTALNKDLLRFFWLGMLPILLVYSGLANADGIMPPASARQAELLDLVRQDCGSCHGLRLTGGLGMPLTAAALKGKSPEVLRDTILYGRNGTAMPPWNPFLTEAEAAWIVQILLKGMP